MNCSRSSASDRRSATALSIRVATNSNWARTPAWSSMQRYPSALYHAQLFEPRIPCQPDVTARSTPQVGERVEHFGSFCQSVVHPFLTEAKHRHQPVTFPSPEGEGT